MSVSAGFFKQEQYESSNRKSNDKTAIDVGSQDLFRAAAAAFIDNLKQNIILSESELNVLMKPLAFYFPLIMQNEWRATESMRWLLNNVRGAELMECMAMVLRRLTVTKMLTNPLRYLETFQGVAKECTKSELYNRETSLPFSALHALTTILPVTIKLSLKEPGKEVRLQHIYASNLSSSSSFELVIQVQGEFYFPVVKNGEYFSSLTYLVKHMPEPIVNVEDNSLDAVWRLLEEQERAVTASYEHYMIILKNMVIDNELTKDKLITLYIQFLPEVSNQLLFAYLAQKKQNTIINGVIEAAQEQTVMLLINALAGGLSLAQIKEDHFFNALEHQRSAPIFP